MRTQARPTKRRTHQPERSLEPATNPLGLSAPVRQRAATLLNQQCWCWGYDIRRPEGNLLLEHGFARRRVPQGQQGSSAYSLELGSGRAVVLWGFGMFYGDHAAGGLYLRREGFNPRLLRDASPPTTIFDVHAMEIALVPPAESEQRCIHALLIDALRWIAGYERWVTATTGVDYRRACVAAWRKSTLPAEEIATAWDALAGRISAHEKTDDQSTMANNR